MNKLSKQKGDITLIVIIIVTIIGAILMRAVYFSGSAEIDKAKIMAAVDDVIELKNNISRNAHNKYDFEHLNNDYILAQNIVPKNWRYDLDNDYFITPENMKISVIKINKLGLAEILGQIAYNVDGFVIKLSGIKKENALSVLQKLNSVFYVIRANSNEGSLGVILEKRGTGVIMENVSGWLEAIYESDYQTTSLDLVSL